MRLTVDTFQGQARGLLERLKEDPVGNELRDLLAAIQEADLSSPRLSSSSAEGSRN
jgi:hypothetical protein